MVGEIQGTPLVPKNVLSDVDNNDDVQKNQEEESKVRTEKASNVNLVGEAEQNEKSSNAETEETAEVESAQRGNEANAKSPADQNESRGTILDILG